MSENNVVITDWKRLWTLISGINRETPENTVLEELQNVSKELQDGLLQFQPISASKTQLETLLKEKKQEKLLPFTRRLQELLDVESKQCWEILCYYLTNEYRGSSSSLHVLIATESNMSTLLDDIWGYYTLERMIVLKIIKNLLTFYKVPTHPYQRQYQDIVQKLTLKKLRDSYLKQLDHLINESPPSKLTAGEFFNYHIKLIAWSERNAREINEVVHILLLLCEHLPMDLESVQKVFNCVKQHYFGKQQRYLNLSNNSTHAQLIERLEFSELVLFMKCLDLPEGIENDAANAKLAQSIVDALEKDVVQLYHSPENGPLPLAWLLFNLRFTDIAQNEQQFIKMRQYGKRAVSLGCFNFLLKLISSSMFRDESLLSRIVRRTVYNLLNYLCDFFDDDGSCAQFAGIYELLCELVSWPTLAKEFCKQKDAVTSLYNTLLEEFPVDFEHMSMLACSLTKAGMGNYIKKQLDCLPILTDLYDDSKYKLRAVAGDEYMLTHLVRPFSQVDFTIPAETSVVVRHRNIGLCAHFRTNVKYFHVLHNEINCLLDETIHFHGDYSNSWRIRRVEAGLSYLEALLKQTQSLAGISEEMVHPTEMCIDLLNKFKVVQSPPIGLLAKCLNVCCGLLPLVDREIFTRVINLNMLPSLNNYGLENYRQYANGMCFDSNLVGSYLVDVEKKSERYDFLLAYLNFLRSYAKLQRHKYFEMEIPGLIFLLRDVFPHLHGWRFKTPADKHKIYIEIMGFICDILERVTNIKGDNSKIIQQKKLVRDICIYSLMSMENSLILLRFVALGNAFLQHTMEMESNWMQQQSHGFILLVRLAMRILMTLLRLKQHVSFGDNRMSPLEALIYTQPKQRDTLRIIPVVTSYMNNIFDRWLPLLSCRLLRRIALEFNMSLLACLDMEPDQIRLTFLQKLPDELESDSLKIAILELVEACIAKQPGMTEAFFKVDMGKEKRLFGGKESSAPIADSILTYLEDYLTAVGKDPRTVEHALPAKIMNLLHHLWKHNMQVLVNELTIKPKFWEQLCNPLFGDLRADVHAYTQLLNILAIEIFTNDFKGQAVITKFLEAKNFDRWLKCLFEMPRIPFANTKGQDLFQDDDEMPEWLCRLQAFKNFLTILMKKQPLLVETANESLKKLAETCLRKLIERVDYGDDLRPFILLLELYLFVLLCFKRGYNDTHIENERMLLQLIELLSKIESFYADMHARAREAFLCILIKCTELLAEELIKDSSVSLKFLHSIVTIICIELEDLESCARTTSDSNDKNNTSAAEVKSQNSNILSLNLLETVANVFHNDGPTNWDLPFITNRLFQRLLSCASGILTSASKHKLSVELLDVLIVFARGNCSVEFLHCDVGDYLFLNLLPPKDLLQMQKFVPVQANSANGWTAEKWWPIYARGIELMTILFGKHDRFFLKETLQFIGIHQEYLVDTLLLGKQTLQPVAVNLIKNTCSLISLAVNYEKEWRLEHPQSLFNLMRALQIILGHSVSMFHQPKNLKSLVSGRRTALEVLQDNVSAGNLDELLTTLNDLLEMIILCAKSLQSFSPKLIDLICEPAFESWKFEPIFEMNFGAPKMDENSVQLTFGTVLSIIGVLTKALNLQNHNFDEVPLNTLPMAAGTDTVDVTHHATLKTQSKTQQRTFSKSLSVVSVSSASCPPNELLSNLDGELCLLALEHILMLVASQSMFALRNPQLPPREKQIVRREISTELLTFHELVRKRVLVEHRDHKDLWRRKKHGLVLMHLLDIENGSTVNKTTEQAGTSTPRVGTAESSRRHLQDLRMHVVRRQHLQHQQQQTRTQAPFEMSHAFSPIGSSSSSTHDAEAISSTPQMPHPPMRRSNDSVASDENVKRLSTMQSYENDDDEIEFFPPDEPKYSPLSFVQLVEEDYLHLMSSLFIVICQSE